MVDFAWIDFVCFVVDNSVAIFVCMVSLFFDCFVLVLSIGCAVVLLCLLFGLVVALIAVLD